MSARLLASERKSKLLWGPEVQARQERIELFSSRIEKGFKRISVCR